MRVRLWVRFDSRQIHQPYQWAMAEVFSAVSLVRCIAPVVGKARAQLGKNPADGREFEFLEMSP